MSFSGILLFEKYSWCIRVIWILILFTELLQILSLAISGSRGLNKWQQAGPGRQELYDGSGIFISKVEINNIHTEASNRLTEILDKLLGHFNLQTLASQRESLDDTIVHACTGISALQLFSILSWLFYTLFRAIFIPLKSTYYLWCGTQQVVSLVNCFVPFQNRK